MDNSKPIALSAYEKLAERYAKVAETKAENGYIEHPAMRKQIGKVAGLKVLDAGCGPGFLTHWLLEHEAKVTGFDISPKMVEIAKTRTGGMAELFIADMAKPLPKLSTQSFDLIVSSLAIDYVYDWSVPLAEFARVLKPQGRLVMSVQHPVGAYQWYRPENAYGVQYVEALWKGFGGEPVMMPDYYRSFAEMLNPLVAAGFNVQQVIDTKPIEALKDVDSMKYERYSRIPTFMILDCRKV